MTHDTYLESTRRNELIASMRHSGLETVQAVYANSHPRLTLWSNVT
jgi:hypothetical protein